MMDSTNVLNVLQSLVQQLQQPVAALHSTGSTPTSASAPAPAPTPTSASAPTSTSTPAPTPTSAFPSAPTLPLAPIQPVLASAPAPAPPAPPATTYTSNRLPSSARGHPNLNTTPLAPGSHQPFLGPSSLSVSMTANTNQPRHSPRPALTSRPSSSRPSISRPTQSEISEANNGRLLAIDAHFPSPSIRRRRRGRAQSTPALPPDETEPASVFEINTSTGERYIHLEVHVYLPTKRANVSLHLVHNLSDSFVDFLDKNSLRFVYCLRDDTKMVDLMQMVASDMTQSPRQWAFHQPSSSLRQHLLASRPLQLLGLSNRGIPRQRDGLHILVRQSPDHVNELTLARLFTRPNSSSFAKPKICIRKSRLILNFVVAYQGITCMIDSDRHSCRPRFMHSLFSPENEIGVDISRWRAPECECGSEDELDSDDEMEVIEEVMASDSENHPPVRRPTTRSQSRILTQPNRLLGEGPSTSSSQSLSLSHTPPSAPQEHSPRQLWASTWVHSPGRYRVLFDTIDFVKSLYETASSGRVPTDLVISGTDIHAMAAHLIASIKAAAAAKDFTSILSPERSYNLYRRNGSILSTGGGIEREVIYTAFRTFSGYQGTWFLPRFDDRCSIATTMSLSASRFASADRLENLTVLGCLSGLLLIHGIAPEPLSPSLIYFAVNDCNVDCLDEAWVGEWHPNLRAMINRWNEIGPTGDVGPFQSHFATYHDMQIATLQSRDAVQHQALARDILYTALIGTQPPSHTELQAFFAGLKLPCSNGFNLMDVIRSSPGGPSTFISRAWTSLIQDFSSLDPHLSVFTLSPPILSELAGANSPVPNMDLVSLFKDFLKGQGAPCPGLFASAIERFSPLIPFDDIDLPSFRSRVLCWAITGCPHVESEDYRNLSVHFVGPDDTGYHHSATIRETGMKYGQISFRTCFQVARIPVVHLIDLCSRTYPARDEQGDPAEPYTLKQAIESWLLIEILAGIGGHSML